MTDKFLNISCFAKDGCYHLVDMVMVIRKNHTNFALFHNLNYKVKSFPVLLTETCIKPSMAFQVGTIDTV